MRANLHHVGEVNRECFGVGASRYASRRNAVAEEIYLRTGRDVTVPISIYGEVIERCNYKCRYCEYWRGELQQGYVH